MFPEEAMIILDGGRAFNGGNPPAELAFGDVQSPIRRRTRRRRRSSAPSRRPGSRTSSSARRRPGRSGAIRWARSTGAPIRKTFPPGMTKKAWPSGLTPASAAAITAAPMSSAAKFMTSSATPRSPDSRSSRATGTASGPAMQRPNLPPGKFEPVGLSFVGGSLVEPRRDGGATSTSFPRTIRLRPLFLADRPGAAQARLDVQHAAEARRPLVPRICEELRLDARTVALQPATSRRISSSSTWAGMAMRRFGSAAMRCGPNSSASRARSRAATTPTADPSATAWRTPRSCGGRASGPSSTQQVLEGNTGLSI